LRGKFGWFRAHQKSETIFAHQLSTFFYNPVLRFSERASEEDAPPSTPFLKEKYLFPDYVRGVGFSSSSLLLSSLELSDTQVCEPQIRALLGAAAHFCEVVVLKLRTVCGLTVRGCQVKYNKENKENETANFFAKKQGQAKV